MSYCLSVNVCIPLSGLLSYVLGIYSCAMCPCRVLVLLIENLFVRRLLLCCQTGGPSSQVADRSYLLMLFCPTIVQFQDYLINFYWSIIWHNVMFSFLVLPSTHLQMNLKGSTVN